VGQCYFYDFWPKYQLLAKFSIFDEKFYFFGKTFDFPEKLDVWQKFDYLAERSLFWTNLSFLAKLLILDQTVWGKISTSGHNFDF